MAHHRDRGVTLLELLVAMSIFGILCSTATSYFPRLLESFSRNNARQAFEYDMRRAQKEATAEGARIIVTPQSTYYTIGLDAYPYDANYTPDSILVRRNLPTGIRISATARIIFNSAGYLIDENSNLTKVNWSMTQHNSTFITGCIFSTGYVAYACS